MDRYWISLLYIFKNHDRLSSLLTTKYFDLKSQVVHINKLREATKPWSNSEKFMLDLALHLFNQRNKINLAGMDSLDSYNFNLAIEAIRIRFK
jgi:hypothetical protein